MRKSIAAVRIHERLQALLALTALVRLESRAVELRELRNTGDRRSLFALLVLEEHRTLVEPACGAALAALSPQREAELLEMGIKSVVVVVCGGSAVSIDLLQDYKRRAELSEG